MRILELTVLWTIVLDFLAWFVLHMGFSILTLKMPDRFFAKERAFFQIRTWEKNGRFWQDYARVKSWKDHLPDGAALFKKGFRKKSMLANEPAYYERFVHESRRAELTHWLVMLPAPLFFLWNPFWVGWVMIVYAILVNAPCIIAQRFNRPRFQRLLSRHR